VYERISLIDSVCVFSLCRKWQNKF